MRRMLIAVVAATSLAIAPSPAVAAAPIMTLADVHAGMQCTGLSVIQGTTISSFAVEVLDVLGAPQIENARILVRLSGPAVDATGVGPGFSGSPVLCPGPDGVPETIGAISETISSFGGLTVLATPIEAVLAEPVLPPGPSSAAAPAPPAVTPTAPVTTHPPATPVGGAPAAAASRVLAGARSLAGPLTLGGLSPQLAAAFVGAARKAGRTLVAGPASARAAIAPQPLVPGAAMSVGLASGDVTLGAIGTVTYADGPDIWAFGHSFDGAGRRSLFLQDAFINAVIKHPLASPDLATYKLGTPGNDVGTLTGDGVAAVTGVLGALPDSFPVRVTARDLDTGRVNSVNTRIADEADVGQPSGSSALGLVGAAAAAQAASTIDGGTPARERGEMCVAATVRELKQPLRFCNTYAIDGTAPNALAGAMATDVGSAGAVIDGYRFGTLHPTDVQIGMRINRGLRQAFLTGASAPRRVRRGHTIAVKLHLHRTGTGVSTTRTIRLHVPADAPLGDHVLHLRGTGAEPGSDPSDPGGSDLLVVFDDTATGQDPGPTSLAAVRSAFTALGRYDGVTAAFGGDASRHAYRDPTGLRISGTTRVALTIRR